MDQGRGHSGMPSPVSFSFILPFFSFSAEEETTALLVVGEWSDTPALSCPFNNWNRMTRTGQAGK